MQQTHLTISKLGDQEIQTVVTRGVFATLTPEEIHQAFTQLFEKMQTPDPDNPNLWTVHVNGYRIWGILDEGAGTEGQNLATLLFPEEY